MGNDIELKSNRSNFKGEWKKFGIAIFNPPFLICFVITVFFCYYLYRSDNKLNTLISSAGLSVMTGFLGGILTKKWSDLNEERGIAIRGTVAVRSLKLLWGHIARLEGRVSNFVKCHIDAININKKRLPDEVITLNFEEIIGICKTLREETMYSIENWTDIVPEANISTPLKEMAGMQEKIRLLEADRIGIRMKLSELEEQGRDKSLNEIFELKDKNKQKEKELHEIKQQFLTTSLAYKIPPDSFTAASSDLNLASKTVLVKIPPLKCQKCGELYTNPQNYGNYMASLNMCDNCLAELNRQETGPDVND